MLPIKSKTPGKVTTLVGVLARCGGAGGCGHKYKPGIANAAKQSRLVCKSPTGGSLPCRAARDVRLAKRYLQRITEASCLEETFL